MTVLYPQARLGGVQIYGAEVFSTSEVPWRTCSVRSPLLQSQTRLELGYHGGRFSPVFTGDAADDLGADWRQQHALRIRGLAAWRREVPPKGFQDGRLETVLQWLAAQCGAEVDLNVSGRPMRHYQVRRGTACQAVREVLLAWRIDATLLELDGGILHIGPEDQTPHARAGLQAQLAAGRNLYALSDVGGGHYRLVLPGMAWLRVGHRVAVKHPLFAGQVRVTEVYHRWAGSAQTQLEVMA